jgi:Coenzyme PQQ synthesis protein D (PqqD)
VERAAALPKRELEVEIRRTRTAIFIARGNEHRELSEVAGLIWRLSNGRRTVDQIAAQIADAYEVDAATAAQDALAFLDELAGDGFIAWAG